MSSLKIRLPIDTELPPTLRFLEGPISNYFSAKPPYNNVIFEALIFTPPPQPPRILLLQHTSGGADSNAFSSYWQVPSGKPLADDPTLLHTLARVVREQTGLRLSKVETMIGTEEGFGSRHTGTVQWMRMLYIVEVAELAFNSKDVSAHGGPEGDYSRQSSESSTWEKLDLDSVQIQMDLDKHISYVWATEGDLQEFASAGLYPTDEKAQYQILLEAFAYYRQDFTQLERLRQTRQNAAFNQGFGF